MKIRTEVAPGRYVVVRMPFSPRMFFIRLLFGTRAGNRLLWNRFFKCGRRTNWPAHWPAPRSVLVLFNGAAPQEAGCDADAFVSLFGFGFIAGWRCEKVGESCRPVMRPKGSAGPLYRCCRWGRVTAYVK